MRIIVTGGNGQLGSEIRLLANTFPSFTFVFVDIDDLDITDEQSVRKYFNDNHFNFLINCAAFTGVDLAETKTETAYQVNATAVKILAQLAHEKKMRVIHISTDYVFSGDFNQPITETDITVPLSVYGQSKLQGEQHLLSILPDAYIIRTAWLYSSFGKNFVKTILGLTRQRSELSVVADQFGSPTYAGDLAKAVLTIVESVASQKADKPGIYHYSNEGAISWYDFAYFINNHFGFPCIVKPIRSKDFKTAASRPKFSVLDKTKIKEVFAIDIPHWSESLKTCLARLSN
jgi:dTDP-4-dehydrorhamnose reductase